MRISEMLNIYDFHDSLVKKINYNNSEVTFKIELCNWRQKNYNADENEMKTMELVFKDVKDYKFNGTINTIDDDTILVFECNNRECGNIKVVLEGDRDIKIIEFRGYSVDIFWN